MEELLSIWQFWIKWESGLENVTLFLSRAYRSDPILIKCIHNLYFFKSDRTEYMSVNNNSSLHHFNLSLDVFFHYTFNVLTMR